MVKEKASISESAKFIDRGSSARAPRGEVYLGWASLPRHSATEFLLVGPMHKRRETYQNRRASPLCFGNFFLSGKVLYQCAVHWLWGMLENISKDSWLHIK